MLWLLLLLLLGALGCLGWLLVEQGVQGNDALLFRDEVRSRFRKLEEATVLAEQATRAELIEVVGMAVQPAPRRRVKR